VSEYTRVSRLCKIDTVSRFYFNKLGAPMGNVSYVNTREFSHVAGYHTPKEFAIATR